MGRFSTLRPYLLRYRRTYLLGAVCVVSAVALRLSVPRLLGETIGTLAEEGATPGEDATERIATFALLIAGAALLGGVIRSASRVLVLGNSRRASHDLRDDVFGHLQTLAPSFYLRHGTGQIMSRVINDMQFVQSLLGPVLLYLVETAVLYGVGISYMASTDGWLTLVVLLPFPFFLWRARRIAAQIQAVSRESQQQLGRLTGKVEESLSGYRVIRALALEDFDRERFQDRAEAYRAEVLRLARARAKLAPATMFLASLGAFLVLLVGGPRVIRGESDLGELTAMILYVGFLAGPTGTLGFVLSSLERGAAALGRVDELLGMAPEIHDPVSPQSLSDGPGALHVENLTVRFGPAPAEARLSGTEDEPTEESRTVLDEVSFSVPAGQTLGVVGLTGAGKSVLLRVLSRQLPVDAGVVFLDGADAAQVPATQWRNAVGLVPQETFLFSATLADNVALGRPDAPADDIAEALAQAQLAGDLDQLPDGLETMLGERGVNLSGGQRQRTALSRVALRRPRLLLLDDTLSAVDNETADRMLTALRELMAGRTTVIVAHRVAAVQEADQIVVLDQGRIVERGTHSELLQQGGIYADLWQRQSDTERLRERVTGAPRHRNGSAGEAGR